MNIFYLDHDVVTCAKMHNDKHCVKMILEYAQLLSTAHRFLDGSPIIDRGTRTGRQRTTYILLDNRDALLYRATHINHPSAVWVRQSDANYAWLYRMFGALMDEYTYRYGKTHACERLSDALSYRPKNIPKGSFTQPTPAMPDELKVPGDSIKSYRQYYNISKTHLANWKNRPIPEWFATI